MFPNIFDYNLFFLGPLGFGFGFILFSCVGFCSGCFDQDFNNEPPHFKPGIEEKLGRFMVGIAISLIYCIGYVILKFMGIGCWKILLIFWDLIVSPSFSTLSDILDAIYTYESK